jgi:3,4-dihydroxy-2-butanone 4-phosphate synthase
MLVLTIKNLGLGAIDPDPGLADYQYTVTVNAKEIASGAIRHRRAKGWAALVAAIAKQQRIRRPRRVPAVPADVA